MYKLKGHTTDLHIGGGQFFSADTEYTDIEMSKVSEYVKMNYFDYVGEPTKRKTNIRNKNNDEAAT